MYLTADPIFNLQLNQNNVVLLSCILAAVLSVLTSIIVTSITSKKQYNNEVKKWILEKRALFYLDLYKKVEIIMKDPKKVFDNDFFEMLVKVKPEVKLFASKKTFAAFRKFYNYVRSLRKGFRFFYRKNDPFNSIEVYYDDDGLEQYSHIPCEDDMDNFSCQLAEYKRDNAPKVKEVTKYIDALYQSMRKDLGSNLK